jgi:hypothetical protein
MHDCKVTDPSVALVPSFHSHIGAFRRQRTCVQSALSQAFQVGRDMAGMVFLLLLTAAAILALRHPSIGLRYLRDHSAGFTDSFSTSLQRDRDWLMHQKWRTAFQQEQQMTFSQRMNRWHVLVTEASERFHVPAKWIRTVIQMESGGRTMLNEKKPITSPVGAVGLMQLMPGTYDEMRQQHKLGANPFNPHDNIMAGAAYLSWLHHRYGYPAMFVAYNDGPGNLEAKQAGGRALPAETRNYVAKICATLGTAVPASFAKAARAKFTRPNGQPVWIDAGAVAAIRAPLRGEYSRNVNAVITIGHSRQALRESVAMVKAALRTRSG